MIKKMKTSKYIPAFVIFLSLAISSKAQILTLEQVSANIQQSHPSIKMYDAEIRSMDEAAKGAKSWMPPEINTGL